MSLESYVRSFALDVPTGRVVAGSPIELTATATEILDIPTVEVLTGPVDLNVVLQHVQLPAPAPPGTTTLPPPAPPGTTAWPPPAAATTVIQNVSAGLATAPGAGKIEGWLASISGSLPIGVRDITEQIRVDLHWRLTDVDSGNVLQDVAVLGGALDAQSVTVALPPMLTELTTTDFDLAALPVVRRLGVQLVVRGRVGTTVDTGEITLPEDGAGQPLPPLEVPIVPIPLPSVAALFRDSDLTGNAVLVTVPETSQLGSAAELMQVLVPLNNLLDNVNTAATFTTWAAGIRGLYSAATALASRVPLTHHVGFLNRDGHYDLGKYDFIPGWWWQTRDIEDLGSSALVISATRSITFFEHDDYSGEKLTLDAVPTVVGRFGGAAVRQLHVSVPESDPPGCVSSTGAPGGSWGDRISSYRWTPIDRPA